MPIIETDVQINRRVKRHVVRLAPGAPPYIAISLEEAITYLRANEATEATLRAGAIEIPLGIAPARSAGPDPRQQALFDETAAPGQ